jgi:hypothetical protein
MLSAGLVTGLPNDVSRFLNQRVDSVEQLQVVYIHRAAG